MLTQLQSECPGLGSTAQEPCKAIAPGFKVGGTVALGIAVEVGGGVPVTVGVSVTDGVGVAVGVGVPVVVAVPVTVGVFVGRGVGVGGGRLLTSTLTLPSSWFAVTMSGVPSPSISATAKATGYIPWMSNGMSDLAKLPLVFAK